MVKKISLLCVGALLVTGCTTEDPYTGQQQLSHTTQDAALGAILGATTAEIFSGGRHGAKKMLIGAGIGALAGGVIGNNTDQEEQILRQRLRSTGVSVTRNGNNIILNMPSDITFTTGRADIKPRFYAVLNSVGMVLRKFSHSQIGVYGFTDSTGTPMINDALSQRRAESVAQYLVAQGVLENRLAVQGYGETHPIASNRTVTGRALNRRVEIHIFS